jgi:hypothetical protein
MNQKSSFALRLADRPRRTSNGIFNFIKLSAVVFCLGMSVAPANAIQIVNAAPDILAAAQAEDPRARGAALAKCLNPYVELYAAVVGIPNVGGQAGAYASALDSQVPGLKRLADTSAVSNALNGCVKSFKNTFPKFDSSELTIYILPSFGRFQAQSRTFHDRPVLLLDSGFFATRTQGEIPPAFVHHEMFHLYHYQLRPDVRSGTEKFFKSGQPPTLATLLWVEGLAVHTARQLNPSAGDAELFPSASVVEATKSQFNRLVQAAADHADEATMPAISGFFYFPRMDHAAIPQNCGYVIGEGLINQLLKDRSLEQIMALRDAELSAAMRDALAKELRR